MLIGNGHLVRPSRRFLAGCLDHPLSNGDSQTNFFRKREKITREQEPTLRMPPPKQAFHPNDALTFHIDLRLIVKLELT